MKKIGLIFSIILTMISCSNGNTMRDYLKKMGETPFCIQTKNMAQWIPDSMPQYKNANENIKFIIYSDSTDCTGCYIGKLKYWNDYLSIEEKTNGEVAFMFIMEVRPNQLNIVKNALNKSRLKHIVYLDTLSSFRHNNPQLPDNRLFHTFLLNNKNNVVLVGNPLRDEKIDSLFYKVINRERKKISSERSLSAKL